MQNEVVMAIKQNFDTLAVICIVCKDLDPHAFVLKAELPLYEALRFGGFVIEGTFIVADRILRAFGSASLKDHHLFVAHARSHSTHKPC